MNWDEVIKSLREEAEYSHPMAKTLLLSLVHALERGLVPRFDTRLGYGLDKPDGQAQ